MERRSHNHSLDDCREHPTGDCIIQELLDRLEAAERDLAAVTVSRGGWQTRAVAAEKKVAAVRELHTKTPIYDDQCDDVYCNQEHFEAMDDELYHCATVAYYACEECHKMTDGEMDEYPCPTITALDGVPNA